MKYPTHSTTHPTTLRWISAGALLLAVAAATSPALADTDQDPAALTTVPQVELDRYLGQWHEIAKIPNSFQDQCARATTASYALRDDGRIEVVNSCLDADGEVEVARGVAKIVDRATNAKLEVSFVSFLGWRPFWGDYWVIGLDPDYQWAIVGTPDREYGWVLARTPQLDKRTLEEIFTILESKGYTRDVFELSPP